MTAATTPQKADANGGSHACIGSRQGGNRSPGCLQSRSAARRAMAASECHLASCCNRLQLRLPFDGQFRWRRRSPRQYCTRRAQNNLLRSCEAIFAAATKNTVLLTCLLFSKGY